MSPESKNNEWRPTASLEALRVRADILGFIRRFFELRGVLEVETPLMCATGAIDPHLQAIRVQHQDYGSKVPKTFYLQTSPEYAMKRLLAAGIGSIYQLCKAFREGETGRIHNPEFTMLEWYRLGFNHHQLMDEIDDLLAGVLGSKKAERITYRDLFQRSLNFDPHIVSNERLKQVAAHLNIQVSSNYAETLTRDDWLDLFITHHLEPNLGVERPLMIYDYPETQAALARIRQEEPPVAERFEVYVRGIELANGYHELTDCDAQLTRFQKDRDYRAELGRHPMDIDLRLVQALKAGLPNCAGVAMGVDRLLMLKMDLNSLSDVMAFPLSCA